ncbi:MAG: hypothetical protein KC493_02685 [Bacteriovoracaceae bacterium]|nr:hypothetical protein [Bacteriovoracaceae bacterium]
MIISIMLIATYYLSILGMKKTTGLKGFAIAGGQMGPVLVGITLASSISSTATFVINPGFVYTHGLSAWLHYGIAAFFGIAGAFILLTRKFKKLGEKNGSLTLAQWLYHHYESRSLSLFFAALNLLSLTFIVLILVGCSLILASLFAISQKVALVLCIGFVFSYILFGGSYAHAYTNALQSLFMIGISLFLFWDGLELFQGGFLHSLENVSLNYGSVLNQSSSLYHDYFSVFISSFFITFALMLQPHILTKILFLKSEKDTKVFLWTTFIVGGIFGLMLFIGFYARLIDLDVMRQDAVVVSYIAKRFELFWWGPYLKGLLSLGLLAAGLSTLDGILVSLSTMITTDFLGPLFNFDDKKGLTVSRYILVLVGVVGLALAWNPPALVGLFAQKGVYALAAASLVPFISGVLRKEPLPVSIIFICSLTALFTHFYLNLALNVINPAVSGTWAIFVSLFIWGSYEVISYINSTYFTRRVIDPQI